MSSSIASSSPRANSVVLAALVVAGFCLRPVERELVVPGGWKTEQLASLAGGGGALAVMGGMRSAVAGGFWLQTDLAWERRDAAATRALLNLTVAADERPAYFWLNGARMLAFDLPEWRLAGPVPAAVRRRVEWEQAEEAIRFLEKGLRWHGPDADLDVELGNICLRRLGNLPAAAGYYRLAAEMPGAPYYAGRIYGELLREQGCTREALAWLQRLLPTLPAHDPAARREVVEGRIRALELEMEAAQ